MTDPIKVICENLGGELEVPMEPRCSRSRNA